LIRDRLVRTVKEFDAQGWHRTGTRVDNDSADWLVGRVSELGFVARLESFDFERVIPDECYLEIDGERVVGFPVFDGLFTGGDGVSGVFGFGGSECDIALVEFPAAGSDEVSQVMRHSGGYRAIVGVVRGGVEGLAIRNAEYFDTRGGTPVLQVSSVEYGRLVAATESGAMVRVVVQGELEDSTAQNVIVRVQGEGRELEPLVVMTPRSGWFNCAIERGGGLACWLEIMESLRDSKPVRDVIFIATSGHELGHLGLEEFLELNPELPQKALAWMHLGSSIGAARGWAPRLQTSDEELERLALSSFSGSSGFSGSPELEVVPTGIARGGEALQIYRKKGRFISVVGGHDLFHLEGDRWPEAVDVDGLAAYAEAFVRMVACHVF
jgi:hypothetical protein